MCLSCYTYRKMEGDPNTCEDHYNDRSPLLFSSDEDDEETRSKDETLQFSSVQSPEPVSESIKENPADLAVVRETNRLNRLQELLQGVPPPPSITVPQMDCAEFLSRWKQNKQLFDEAINEKELNKETSVQNNSLNVTLTEKDVRELKWPDVRNIHFYDVYYNLGYCSEELDRLSQKLRERYVGAETSSWCNALSSGFPNSAKKRQRLRNWGQVSPGSRLSHLARRRQTFSSAGLQQLTSASNNPKAGTSGTVKNQLGVFRRSSAGLSERRCIVVDAKKNDTKRPTRGSARKKGPSAAKELKAIPEMKPAVQATKRALFQSPEDQKRPILRPSVPLPDSNDLQESRVLRSKRALWPSTSNPEVSRNVNGKRLLDSGLAAVYQANKVPRADAPYVRSSRSLPLSLHANESDEGNKKGDVMETNNSLRSNNQEASFRVTDMSELHKRKLIWAVSQALRTEGISSKHPDFRPCATALALHYDKVRREWTGPPPTSTSEHMLQVVSARVSEVVQSHRNSRLTNSDTSSEVANRLGEPPFRDASSSLNVRNRTGPVLERRIPSARKSLTFDNFDDSSSKSNKSNDTAQAKATKSDALPETKCDDLRTNAKRVSRSLFGAENEGSKQTSRAVSDAQQSSSSRTLNGSSEMGKSLAKDSSGEWLSLDSREKSTPSGRKRLKRYPEASPTNRRVTRRAWASSQKKEPSSTVESTDSSPHPPSQSDSGEPVSASVSDGFPPADNLEGSASQLPDSPKIPTLETKVITPILEATAMESSTSSKSKEGSVANGDLSFSGRIESLKPAEEEKENNISIDLGLAASASACFLDLKDGEEKEQDLTRWAEMATRSIKKENKRFSDKCLDACSQQQSMGAEESLYPWIGQSQLTETDSQCPTKLYEMYKCIFDSSSQGGNS